MVRECYTFRNCRPAICNKHELDVSVRLPVKGRMKRLLWSAFDSPGNYGLVHN